MFREHVITCFIDDDAGVALRDRIGIDTITWECDYPHSDSTWPRAPEILWRSLQGLTDLEIDKITHLNTMRFFQYDPFRHIPREQCTVGALRAQAKHVDLSPRSNTGGKPPSNFERGYATIGDIIQQMATAFAVPIDNARPVS